MRPLVGTQHGDQGEGEGGEEEGEQQTEDGQPGEGGNVRWL